MPALIESLHVMNMWEEGVTISEDHERPVVGASSSKLRLSGRGRPRSGKDLREIVVPEWWHAAPDRGCL